jgi:hypothetical protein
MTNVLARSSAKQGSTTRLKGIAMLPVDGVKLREPLGPDKARLAAIERDADRGLPECSQQRRIRSTPASKTRSGMRAGRPRLPGQTTRNLERETR